ncbi:cupin domain-containing protein [Puniceicoccales bacterium CK1056]|uniref:Cupin domain-containing protein n=1 Tax=Oceanipulchritudo coccoides TaxID=2706888 RepID=A0A6B2M1H0_9BACT|nr:cupin domain-containing protein [Oceanipulchritudo coccoides]NDV61927.1 cupin domain-containing protein [Oceanipulchritudo coccoides]
MSKFNIKCLVSSIETGGKVSVFEEVVTPGSGPPLHTHEEQLEIFHVISGHIQFELEGERIDVYTGGTATIPPGKKHAFVNKSEKNSIIHFELLPSGKSEEFFERLVAGRFEDIPSLFEEHGLKLLGPPIK